jgi:hypothetical protein
MRRQPNTDSIARSRVWRTHEYVPGCTFHSWGETCPECSAIEGYATRRFDTLSERVCPRTETHPMSPVSEAEAEVRPGLP